MQVGIHTVGWQVRLFVSTFAPTDKNNARVEITVYSRRYENKMFDHRSHKRNENPILRKHKFFEPQPIFSKHDNNFINTRIKDATTLLRFRP